MPMAVVLSGDEIQTAFWAEVGRGVERATPPLGWTIELRAHAADDPAPGPLVRYVTIADAASRTVTFAVCGAADSWGDAGEVATALAADAAALVARHQRA